MKRRINVFRSTLNSLATWEYLGGSCDFKTVIAASIELIFVELLNFEVSGWVLVRRDQMVVEIIWWGKLVL